MAYKMMSSRSKAITETWAILGCAAAASIASSYADAFEKLCALTRHFEHIELDELLPVAFIFSIAFATLASRRRRYHAGPQALSPGEGDHSRQKFDRISLPTIEDVSSRPINLKSGSKKGCYLVIISINSYNEVIDNLDVAGIDDFRHLIALRLDSALRSLPSAILVRQGEKFVCVLPSDAGEQTREAMAEKLLEAVRAPLPGWASLPVSASALVIECTDGESLSDTLQRTKVILNGSREQTIPTP